MNAWTRALTSIRTEEPTEAAGPEGETERARRLEAAIECARGGMWDHDFIRSETRRTEFYYRMMGETPCEEPIPVSFWRSRVHHEDLESVERQIREIIAGRASGFEAEYRYRHADGSWRSVLDRGRVTDRDASGKPTRMVGFINDITEQVATQEALRRSEFRYRTVASLAPGFVFEHRLSASGKPLPDWASDGIEAVFGCKYQEIDSHGGWFALLEEEQRPVSAARQARLAQGEPQSGEARVRTVDGQKKWLYVSMVPVRDAQTGQVNGVLGSAYDITTRKLAEQALLESEAVLRAVTTNTPDWLFLVDDSLRVRFLNRQFGEFGSEQVIGRPLLELMPQPHRASLEDLYLSVLSSSRPGRVEVRLANPNGVWSYFEHRVVPVMEAGAVRALTVAVTDVTERKRSETELLEQRDAMRTQSRILETMREGVVLIDAATNVVKLTNPMFARMFGYDSGEELLGLSVEPLFSTPALQRARAARSLHGAAATEAMPVELDCARRDGSRFVAACFLTPLRMAGANHWLAVFNDVTERKRLEREIIEISNREQQRIGSDLHDGLGQELTGIALMLKGVVSQLQKEGSAATFDVEDVISLVNNAIESTRSLARGLSPVSGERGGLAPALKSLAARASERYGIRVDFETDLDATSGLSETAATHVYRIIQEALTNVIRHSKASKVSISLATSGGEIELRVQDNGLGLPNPAPESFGGGLGLKIMRYRARMLGGDLFIEGAPNGGVCIRCLCPLEFEAEGDQGKEPRPAVPGRG
jgi:PAS domain S-box-containing protein